VIVLDPGHSPSIHAIDKHSGLDVSDYANAPEMQDVFAVAVLVKKRLIKDGYRVVMTKATADARVDLAERAAIANKAHAALAVSIHDQAGAVGGIGFRSGNNIVYAQSVGGYRVTPGGRRVSFTKTAVAKDSLAFARVFVTARAKAQRTTIHLQRDIGYDMASRGLPGGDMWMVQLLSSVPWVYNEAGGNSLGRVGLDTADKHAYAAGLISAIEKCVPPGE
jgi:N-acetylmuramoyl-L-alanine amidase